MFFNLDCYFVGNRTYIQGSQIIAHAAKHLADVHNYHGLQLTGAKLVSITQNQVFASDNPDQDLTTIGQIAFADGKGEELTLFLLTDTKPITKRVVDRQPDFFDLRDIDKLNGCASFDYPEASLQNILCSMIAANKELHSRLGETVHDIWFTGLNKLILPCNDEALVAKGTIEFAHMFTAGKHPRQTMSRVSVKNEQNELILPVFVIIFAYKT